MATTIRTPAVPTRSEGQARVAEEASFEGRWSGADLWVEGTLEGDVVLNGVLRIGRTGRLRGRVRAAVVEVEGAFDGEIITRLLMFGDTARAKGTFASERLIVRDGAVADGAFKPSTPEPPPAAPADSTLPMKAVAPESASPAPEAAPASEASPASESPASPEPPAPADVGAETLPPSGEAKPRP